MRILNHSAVVILSFLLGSGSAAVARGQKFLGSQNVAAKAAVSYPATIPVEQEEEKAPASSEATEAKSVPGEASTSNQANSPDPRQVILAAKRVAVVGMSGAREEVCLGPSSVCPDGKGAKKRTEGALRKWGRFTLVEDPGEADLVLVAIEGNSSEAGITVGSSYGVPWAELLVFKGPGPVARNAQYLWQGSATAALLWAYPPTGRLVKMFRKAVEKAEKSAPAVSPDRP